ncbi:MAG: hypothetical protein J3K34DRAFT_522830 [Monoraphidium minutum]|nr:MAG: hypothetical protein J3K34DRAFT_522830 [Monoraphidium minutum]
MAVLKEIAKLEEEVANVLEKAVEAVGPLDKQLAAEVQKLGERRHALVTGKAAPDASELAACDDAEAVAAAGAAKGCPFFWASVLSNCDAVGQAISGRDRLALEYLRDVRRVGGARDGARGVELVFDPKNPYFTNKVLRRVMGGGVDEGTHIDWKAGYNLTVKEVARRGKKAKKGKAKGGGGDDDDAPARTRLKPVPSFFRFFEAEEAGGADAEMARLMGPEIEEAGDDGEGSEEDERAAAKREADAELLGALRGPVVLRATHLYLEGPLQGGSGGGGGGGGSGGGGSDDEDDGFELVAGGGGDVSDLPPPTRAVVAALGDVQARLDAAVGHWAAAKRAAGAGAAKALRGLYARRAGLLAGEAAPRAYWLRVLRAVDAAALAITPRDAAVLQHLVDVRYEVEQGGGTGGSNGGDAGGEDRVTGLLELEFARTCPQLPGGAVLRKSYNFVVGSDASGGPALRLLSARVLDGPTWAPSARDPTHRRGRDGRPRPAASFFQLFRASGGGGKLAFNLAGPEREVAEEANALEVEMLEALQGGALPATAAAYAAAPDEDDIAPSGDDGGSSGDDESEASGSDGGGEAGAARRAALKARKEHDAGGRPWWRLSRGGALILLLGLMILGQYLALIMHLTGA